MYEFNITLQNKLLEKQSEGFSKTIRSIQKNESLKNKSFKEMSKNQRVQETKNW
ncbi:unnamed protein product [Paramecium primaurelia]|uniref:Uncharacterized protein n=1 Tax=Paramecium primaurelia TaxID=5886 RepID=A0A8S1JWH5_PARPR|nr:unnamed protein product [Paramecium primaurelia]